MFQFSEIENEKDYNPLIISPDANFSQSFLYGDWKKKMGQVVRRFKVLKNEKSVGFFQIIKYEFPFARSYLNIPHGPVIKNPSEEFLKEFKEKMSEIAKEENAVFLRFDIYPTSKDLHSAAFKKAPFYSYHSAFLHSKFDWVLDIGRLEEELLKEMHPKTRYNIRLAERKGVKVEIIKGQDLEKYFDTFYKLMQETAQRGKFGLHPKKYYKQVFESALKNENIVLFIAKYNNEILATNMVIFYGDTAFYPFGASSEKNRNLMAPYLAHWLAIKFAQKRGLKFYNFGAIDVGKKISHENWSGISTFKRRFGGFLQEYSDFYDQIFKPFWYYLYNLRKKIKSL